MDSDFSKFHVHGTYGEIIEVQLTKRPDVKGRKFNDLRIFDDDL